MKVTSSEHPARAIPRGEFSLGRDIVVRCTEIVGERYDPSERKRHAGSSGWFHAKVGREDVDPVDRRQEWSCASPSA